MKPTSIYSMLLEMSTEHTRLGKHLGYQDMLLFDQTNKRIYNGSTVIVDNGKVMIDKIKDYDGLKDVPLMTEEERQLNIDELYAQYKTSVPDKYSDNTRSNFKAKHLDELTTKEMVNGKPRNYCRYALEMWVMFTDLANYFIDGNFFWKSPNNPELILFSDWI